jgi:Tfp pilus assembly protein PilO
MKILTEYKTESRSLIKDVQQLAVFSGLSYAEVMYMSLEERTVLAEVVKEKIDMDAQLAGIGTKKTDWM